ncbi:MAG: DNA translocase FtsK 4TM domain-containing protein [Deltaproteobacteria bacterium]|nr:DNA translocase FtsK 4TM domain-containing protein [Deltaproteobacteria bacterium]
MREFLSLLLVVFAIFLTLALYSHVFQGREPAGNMMGIVGGEAAAFLSKWLGWCSFVAVLWALLLARTVWRSIDGSGNATSRNVFVVLLSSILLAGSGAALVSVFFGTEGGGLLGTLLSWELIPYLNHGGAALVSTAVFFVALVLSTGITGSEIVGVFAKTGTYSGEHLKKTATVSGRIGRALAKAQLRLTVLLARKSAGIAGETLSKMRRKNGDVEPPLYEPELVDEIEEDDFEIEAFVERKPKRAAIEHKKQARIVDDSEEDEDDIDEEEPVAKKGAAKSEPASTVPALGERRFDAIGRGLKEHLLRKKEKGDSVEERPKRKRSHQAFSLPPIQLLSKPEPASSVSVKREELVRNCKQLEQTLLDFRIGGQVVDAQPGPVITLYEFDPAPGIKVQKIVNLADDLARALKVESVRVYAPVPGKGTVGIEVPNMQREIVRLREILDNRKFLESETPLALALGKDTSGEPYYADLSRMPHLLIAGATGTGKSVCINSLLLSILYQHTPEEVRLLMIDPKMLELSVYEGIPHLKAPVVTLPRRARGVLHWAVEEMERRYRLMLKTKVRNIDSYNKAIRSSTRQGLAKERDKEESREFIELDERHVISVSDSEGLSKGNGEEAPIGTPEIDETEPLPRIVIIVDEFADLMLSVGREIEELVTRLAQKARASGIHLILATQRPSVDVITGLIKANFPARISFKVASRIDARTVLDTSGSEKLLGNGDMLFMTGGAGRMKRVHSAFVSDGEVTEICDWLRKQGAPDYDPQIEATIQRLDDMEKGGGTGLQMDFEFDPLYDQAVNVVVEKGHASTSMIQRAFRIGYNRAASIIESMEREGVVGPADGAKPRQVLAPRLDRMD